MVVLEDIRITLTAADVMAFFNNHDKNIDLKSLDQALSAFHQARKARAVFDYVEIVSELIDLDRMDRGAVAVAATLGAEVGKLPGQQYQDQILQAGLFQLEAFLNYRIKKRMAARRLYIGPPAVPGGAVAPSLRVEQVLDLLGGEPLGIRAANGALEPAWSLAYLYPVSSRAWTEAGNHCLGCTRDCALRKK